MKGKDWYGTHGRLVKCPFPECNHIGDIISKIHCRLVHVMEREEVGKLYGPPTSIGNGRRNIKRRASK